MISSKDEMVFLVASRGTEPLGGADHFTELDVHEVDGRQPTPYHCPVSAERIERLLEQLDDKRYGKDFYASQELLEIGEPAMPALLSVLKGEKTSCPRGTAAEILSKMGSKAVPPLSDLLLGAHPEACDWAADALPGCGESGVEVLVGALGSPHAKTRSSAARNLRFDYPGRQAALPALIDCLADTDARVQEYAAEALGSMEGDAIAALPALLTLLAEGKGWAAGPICRLGPEVASTATLGLLKAVEAGVSGAHEALTKAQQMGGAALPSLVQGLDSPKTRHAAICGIRKILEHSNTDIPNDLVPALIRALEDSNQSVRRIVASCLEEIGPAAKAAIPALRRCLEAPSKRTADAARCALSAIEG